MGEGQNRGLTQRAATDLVRNIWSMINTLGDELAALIPYKGTATGSTDGSGYAVITHNLGFTPSSVFVVSRLDVSSTRSFLLTNVDTITSTTFRVRLATISGGGPYTLTFGALAYSIAWQAFR